MSSEDKSFLWAGILIVVVMCLLTAFVVLSPLEDQETCLDGDGWIKYENVDNACFTVEPDEGLGIGEVCLKAGTDVFYNTYDPPIIISVQICSPTKHDISHISLRYVKVPTPTPSETPTPFQPETDTPTPTPEDPTETPTETPEASVTPSPTDTPEPSPTRTPCKPLTCGNG